jgi:predicted AAA+ superfamily ATPase
MIARTIKKKLLSNLFKGKTFVIIGARQVGKTTLIRDFLKGKEFLFLDGDDPLVKEKLSHPNTQEIAAIIGNAAIVFIDEAQRIDQIGITAKIIHDQFKKVQLILSGSSAFELRNRSSESLTGRKIEYFLYPISYEEYEKSVGYLNAEKDLEHRLIYGFYPEVINQRGNERDVLNELTQSYLYKDILSFGGIKKPEILEKILQALAFQVGSEVSYNEIAQLTGVDKNTVSNYIQLLEYAQVIFHLTSFSRNLRNEIKTNRKIYFNDNGIRNALIQNFNPVSLRNDVGSLWENFLIAERYKRNHYHQQYCNSYFWRTKQQQEIDYVEEANGNINGFVFKWNPKAKSKIPASFVNAYNAKVTVIDSVNFRDFIGL